MKNKTIRFLNILLILTFFSLALFGCSNVVSGTQTKKIKITFNKSACLERNYEEIKFKLEKEGFTNIKVIPEKKGIFFLRKEENVSYISIDGKENWEINDVFDADDLIVIKYWSSKKE